MTWYKNAMRLTRTETNMAYHTADQERWQQLDFVRGYRVTMSGNHPCTDICDELSAPNGDTTSDRGVYPKTFVFKGWHPQCRCFCTPILMSQDEFTKMQQAMLDGKEYTPQEQQITDYPKEFHQWVKQNESRINAARNEGKTLPYFIQDNQQTVDGILNQKKTGMSIQERAEARHSERTSAQIQDITTR